MSAGDGIVRGKQQTLSALEGIAQMNVNASNWRILAAEVELLDIPQKHEIIEGWRAQFERQQMPPEPQTPHNDPITGASAAFPDFTPELAGGASPAPTMETEVFPYEM